MSGQNYIGSKISLISLSDIRYVGILHNINSLDSTVALQNVTSFGTEGRKRDPREEIPGSDTVFDYVVFRGSDIKDLQVFEAPPSFHQQRDTNAYYTTPYYQMPVPENYQTPPTLVQEKIAVPVDEEIVDSLIKQVSDLDITPSSPKKTIQATVKKTTVIQKKEERDKNENQHHKRERGKKHAKKEEQLNSNKREENMSAKQEDKHENGNKRNNDKNANKRNNENHSDSPHKEENNTVRQKDNNKRDFPRRNSSKRQNGIFIPKSDFDFASSNARFDKNDLTDDQPTTNSPTSSHQMADPEHFYDKSKSFFDDISCDAKERGAKRSYKEESKLNLETFGQANARHRHRRGRGKPSF